MSTTTIPSLHHSSPSKVKGGANIFILSRKDVSHSGTFDLKVDAAFDPATAPFYPSGSLSLRVDLSDSLKGTFIAKSIEVMNSHGKHNPTVELTGRCDADLAEPGVAPKGLHFWVLIADNKSEQEAATPDIVSFVVCDSTGARVAYGSGPVAKGDLIVAPN